MGQYRFIKVDEDGSKIVHVFNDMCDLDFMCEKFTEFLRANGYIFDHMAKVAIEYPDERE